MRLPERRTSLKFSESNTIKRVSGRALRPTFPWLYSLFAKLQFADIHHSNVYVFHDFVTYSEVYTYIESRCEMATSTLIACHIQGVVGSNRFTPVNLVGFGYLLHNNGSVRIADSFPAESAPFNMSFIAIRLLFRGFVDVEFYATVYCAFNASRISEFRQARVGSVELFIAKYYVAEVLFWISSYYVFVIELNRRLIILFEYMFSIFGFGVTT